MKYKFRAILEIDVFVEAEHKARAVRQAYAQIEETRLPNSYLKEIVLVKSGESFVFEKVEKEER